MVLVPLSLLLAATPSLRVEAQLFPELDRLAVTVTSTGPGPYDWVLPPDPDRPLEQLTTVVESQLYPVGPEPYGLAGLQVRVDQQPCAAPLAPLQGGLRRASCPTGTRSEVQGNLQIPNAYGARGRRGRSLTLGGGWFPFLQAPDGGSERGRLTVILKVPAGLGVTVADRIVAPRDEAQTVELVFARAASVPLVVRSQAAGFVTMAEGRARFLTARPGSSALATPQKSLEATIQDGLSFLDEHQLPAPTRAAPLLVAEAPLRRDLAQATPGLLLVSDRAFRLTPVERFLRFHRFPILRELYTVLLFERLRADPDRALAADALGAWLRDRYVASRVGRAEDAFDVLTWWSFIPAVDSLLYAPQLPFIGAYFRLIDETDPHRPDFLDAPSGRPRGKLLYEKLVDRLGPVEVSALFARVMSGAPFRPTLEAALGPAAPEFFRTWLGPYPRVQYRLGHYGSAPDDRCPERPCYLAEVELLRSGAAIEEPLQVRLEDEAGRVEERWAPPSLAERRVLTATLSAPLDFVELDPHGRLAETPSAEVPSPKFDNRSSARWRFLLNNFNLLLSPTAGQLETALDVGFSRVRDVHWRFAGRVDYSPSAVAVSARGLYAFGSTVTPDRLAHYVGATVEGSYLRPEFAGTTESAFAFSAATYYAYDDRLTSWLPDRGSGLRLGLGYDRTFGSLDPAAGLSNDALSISARALRSFRAHGQQLTFLARAAGFLVGEPRAQLRYPLGGRGALRGYVLGDEVFRYRGLLSAEWVHPLLPEANDNAVELVWATRLEGALCADLAMVSDRLADLDRRALRADVGYGFRVYLDYFGVRPGVMSIDIAFPLIDPVTGRGRVGPPAVYIDFAQSFLNF